MVDGGDDLRVRVAGGVLRGKLRRGVRVWRGIPYAAPPRRFAPPEPPRAWTGERDATRPGSVAEQSRDPRLAMMSGVGGTITMSEDCLTLDVCAPATPSTTPRPVLVWIHGGAFVMGSGSSPLYDGTSFAARHDLIVVTLNYRLGLLGFLYLSGLGGLSGLSGLSGLGELGGGAAGNYALLDQIAALTWVRDNIAAFGGDPGAVTVMGESAGAVSIATLLAMPAARGLFHRAILQSGASGMAPPTRADATALARDVIAQLDGVSPADAPIDALMSIQDRLVRHRGVAAFLPYVDGVTVPRSPIEVVRAGDAMDVPLLLGSNRDEWTLFAMFFGESSVEALKAPVRERFGAEDVTRMVAAYRAQRAGRDERAAWIDLIGDLAFRIPMIRLAEAQAARGVPVWMYRFDWASTAFDGRLGAAHAIELPLVWNQLDAPFAKILLGDVDGARALGAAMHDTWARFARGGEPEGAGLPPWSRYDGARRATLLLDRECRVVDDPGGDTRALWPAAWRTTEAA